MPSAIRLVSARLAVADGAAAEHFYRAALDFGRIAPPRSARPGACVLALGDEAIEIDASGDAPCARPPVAADDPSFTHLAIVTRDIDAAWTRVLAAGALPISSAPQRIPDENPASGGVRAAYLRDPHGHPFELLWFPANRGDARWHRRDGPLFLGIDHLARVTTATQRACAFYGGALGFTVASESLNEGVEQERLSGVDGARVRITTLRGEGSRIGVELLEYLAPPERPRAADTGTPFLTELFRATDAAAIDRVTRGGYALRWDRDHDAATGTDPDGHHLEIAVG